MLNIKPIEESYKMVVEIAKLWTKVSKLFYKIGDTKDVEYVNQVSELLIKISMKEKEAMELLLEL